MSKIDFQCVVIPSTLESRERLYGLIDLIGFQMDYVAG